MGKQIKKSFGVGAGGMGIFSTGDLLPQSSGSAAIGVNTDGRLPNGPIKPYSHVHMNSGVFHNPFGSSGIIRFGATQIEISVDGGKTYSVPLILNGAPGEVYYNNNGTIDTNPNFTFQRANPVEASVGISGVLDLRSRSALRGLTVAAPSSGITRLLGVNLAGRAHLGTMSSGQFVPQVLQSALFNSQKFMAYPSTGSTIDTWGNTLTSVGTVTHPTVTVGSGYMANLVSGATAGNTAGTGSAALLFFRGGLSGTNTGFFFATRITLPDATNDRIRIFAGLTTSTFATAAGSDNFAGDYAGFQYSNARGDLNWQFVVKDNTTQSIQNCGIFCSGSRIYDMYIYSPPYPNNGAIYWTLQDQSNNTEVNGYQFNNLPRVNQAMRAGFQMSNVVAVARNIRFLHLYCESE